MNPEMDPGATLQQGGPVRKWSSLSPEEHLALRQAFGHYLDSLPPTCSMDTKVERFRTWLATQPVDFDGT